MKRAACLALAMSMVMGTTAFAAERNPIVLVNRQEFFLQDTAMQKKVKIVEDNGNVKSIYVCTRCMRSNKITRAI